MDLSGFVLEHFSIDQASGACPRRLEQLKGGVVGEVSNGDDGLHSKPNPWFPTKIEMNFVDLRKASINRQTE